MNSDFSYTGAWATIMRTENGWIIYGPDPATEGQTTMSVAEDEKIPGLDEVRDYGPVRSLQSAFFRIIEFLNAWGGRYDAERIRINIEPGDKYDPKGYPAPIVNEAAVQRYIDSKEGEQDASRESAGQG